MIRFETKKCTNISAESAVNALKTQLFTKYALFDLSISLQKSLSLNSLDEWTFFAHKNVKTFNFINPVHS